MDVLFAERRCYDKCYHSGPNLSDGGLPVDPLKAVHQVQIWPAASRESLFVSHIRRVDELKSSDAHDLYIVCNKDVTRADVPVTSSSGIRVGLTVSMIFGEL
ncbi:hypothetical protein OSTOST_16411 [Ostertagia ostertagi]